MSSGEMNKSGPRHRVLRLSLARTFRCYTNENDEMESVDPEENVQHEEIKENEEEEEEDVLEEASDVVMELLSNVKITSIYLFLTSIPIFLVKNLLDNSVSP